MLKLSGWPRLTWGRVARAAGRSRPPARGSRRGPRVAGRGARRPACTVGSSFRPPLVAPCLRGRPALQPAALLRPGSRTEGQSPRPAPGGARSDARRDAQAGVPSAGGPRAQLAFKDSMVRGILQFTPSIAFRYVLHRCESRDIRCRESFRCNHDLCTGYSGCAGAPPPAPLGARTGAPAPVVSGVPWRLPRRGGFPRGPPAVGRGGRGRR